MITVSLETAKKMNEAGWSKETLFSYDTKGLIYFRVTKEEYKVTKWYKYAPTAQEILDELPAVISEEFYEKFGTSFLDIVIYGKPKIYRARYDHWGEGDEKNNLVETLASLWIRAKKNGFLSSKSDV